MIIGTHTVIYSTDPDADCRFCREVLGLPSTDAGGGYLIFGLPPGEASVHASSKDGSQHEFYLLCDDIETFVADIRKHGVSCSPVKDQGWGALTEVTLPSGGKVGVYEPRYTRPTA